MIDVALLHRDIVHEGPTKLSPSKKFPDPTGSSATTTAVPSIQAAAAAMLRRPRHNSDRTSAHRRRCSNVFLPHFRTPTVSGRQHPATARIHAAHGRSQQ